jgi:hypothetical protein
VENEMSFDDEGLKKQVENMRKSNQETYDLQNKEAGEYYTSTTFGDFRIKMMLERVFSDIHSLQKTTLMHTEFFIMMKNKISSLENRINQNLKNIIELSKRVKETESFQDELNQQLNKAIKDTEEFNKIANGINEIVEIRKKDLEKNNEKKDEESDNKTDEIK